VSEADGEVVFLKKIQEGPAAGSYGIHVARLAGLPFPVLERAREVHEELSRKEKILPQPSGSGQAGLKEAGPSPASVLTAAAALARGGAGGKAAASQGGLFDPGELVLAELASLDPDKLTPLEALTRLSGFRKQLQSR